MVCGPDRNERESGNVDHPIRRRIRSERGAYTVLVGEGLLARLGELAAAEGVPRPRAVGSDVTVGPLWARAAAEALGAGAPLELPDGEASKCWSQIETVLATLLARGLHRGDTVAAVGGGVVTDLIGFAAAVYLRGIDWIAVPTTLLAMVDAAVGGKTGINLGAGKNLAGAFWPPRLVVADVATLATLPPRELRAGLAEVVKHAWIADRGLLELLDRPIDVPSSLSWERWRDLVARAVTVKAEVVEADEREAGRRAALNLGHTVGHALEAVTGYRRFLHGEAVAWGLLAAAELSLRRGLLSESSAGRLRSAVTALGPLPPVADLSVEGILDHLARDKKRDDGGVAWVLPTDDGVVLGQRVATAEVRDVLATLGRGSS